MASPPGAPPTPTSAVPGLPPSPAHPPTHLSSPANMSPQSARTSDIPATPNLSEPSTVSSMTDFETSLPGTPRGLNTPSPPIRSRSPTANFSMPTTRDLLLQMQSNVYDLHLCLNRIDANLQLAEMRSVEIMQDLVRSMEESMERMNVAFEERMMRVERDVRETERVVTTMALDMRGSLERIERSSSVGATASQRSVNQTARTVRMFALPGRARGSPTTPVLPENRLAQPPGAPNPTPEEIDIYRAPYGSCTSHDEFMEAIALRPAMQALGDVEAGPSIPLLPGESSSKEPQKAQAGADEQGKQSPPAGARIPPLLVKRKSAVFAEKNVTEDDTETEGDVPGSPSKKSKA